MKKINLKKNITLKIVLIDFNCVIRACTILPILRELITAFK